MIGTKLLNRYEIIEHIGDGATATVYRGRDTSLGRMVALKVLLPHVRDNTRERFFQEAMAAAQLNHPNIMAIYDRGEDGGRHFLVVEYVDGDPLSAYIPSSPDMVVQLGAQIARALDYAHERDIIHRDIKPANIMVTPEGQVKIMDLGLALPREAKRVTAPGMVIGTPAYISPEQAQGKELDRRTDIYSLGIVLYEMATGQLPFNADDITALLLQHVRQQPPPPRLVVADLPVAMERVILKTLEKQATRRFQSGRNLAEALEATISSPTATPDAPTAQNRPDWAQTLSTKGTGSLASNTSGRAIRIVLADDHALLRRSLASLLEQRDDFVVLAEVSDGDAALRQAIDLQPDVLLLDLNMPGKGGLEVLPSIRNQAPNVKVLVLTGREENIYIMRALRAGAHGYLLKSTDEESLFESIYKVMRNEMVLGKGVAERVVGGLLGGEESTELTNTERDVLLHVSAGYDNDAISRKLGISMAQMIELMATILDKLKVRDRSEAALRALRDGQITLDDLHEIKPPSED
jgi:serine/threonine protein kinase/DNA-binding CsgD family transcriptional regulator